MSLCFYHRAVSTAAAAAVWSSSSAIAVVVIIIIIIVVVVVVLLSALTASIACIHKDACTFWRTLFPIAVRSRHICGVFISIFNILPFFVLSLSLSLSFFLPLSCAVRRSCITRLRCNQQRTTRRTIPSVFFASCISLWLFFDIIFVFACCCLHAEEKETLRKPTNVCDTLAIQSKNK